jgi:hypothetical protein
VWLTICFVTLLGRRFTNSQPFFYLNRKQITSYIFASLKQTRFAMFIKELKRFWTMAVI